MKQRNIVVCILLSLVTCGIYGKIGRASCRERV